ncbi:hypothetical protein [Alteromonas sp. CYL-A6]|uniref:hypothetical protein n=1 Tax=Alteromonas nitratireducens TaxID=3390813 RepID=UPI0034BDEB49
MTSCKHVLFLAFTLMFFCVTAQADQDNDGPIRLETTIRGNKEQPSVLSIVPWQLPKYRKVEGALSWQPAGTPLTPLSREQFLRQLALTRYFQENQSDGASERAQ